LQTLQDHWKIVCTIATQSFDGIAAVYAFEGAIDTAMFLVLLLPGLCICKARQTRGNFGGVCV